VSKKNCWIISDGLVGHEKQSISLAKGLNINYKIIKIKKLNFFQRNLSFLPNLKKKIKEPKPKFLISCGKHTAYYAKLIKKEFKKKIFSIFIQKPPINTKNFDLVIVPKHDNCNGKNIINTNGALTNINKKYVKQHVKNKKKPNTFKKKFITVLIGGNSRHHKITKKILDEIINKLNYLEDKTKINFYLLFSRRTNKNDYLYLKKKIINKKFFFILPNSTKVSYINALCFSEAIIVTSDSVSMVTEACSTGKPTYIINIPTKSKKFTFFIKNLINLKLAYYLKKSLSLKKKTKTLNDIDIVIKKIKKKIKI
tara:strand:+ start:1488 stop:2420 length:933 start_codon:yes stop_codon:yes gene_type:complete